MFLGHWGVGFGAKRAAPGLSLGTLFLAAQFLDLLWPTLLLFGLEHVVIAPGSTRVTPLDFTDYPISHSLLAAIGWGALVGVAYYALRRSRRGAFVCAILVPSHWLLDLLVHRPDLPLLPIGGPKLGLGLWSSVPLSVAAELVLLAAGLWLYLRTTRPRDRTGSWALAGLVVFLLVVFLLNISLSISGPPPPSVTAVAWSGQAQWLLVLWGFWIDRHRETTTP